MACESDSSSQTSAAPYCSTYTKAPTTTSQSYPPYISAFSTAPLRISSACICLNGPNPTPDPSCSYKNAIGNGNFDILDPSKPSDLQAPPWIYNPGISYEGSNKAILSYGPVNLPNTPPNAAFAPPKAPIYPPFRQGWATSGPRALNTQTDNSTSRPNPASPTTSHTQTCSSASLCC